MIKSWEDAQREVNVPVWDEQYRFVIKLTNVSNPEVNVFMLKGNLEGKPPNFTPIIVDVYNNQYLKFGFGMTPEQAEKLALALLDQAQFLRGELEK